MKAGDKVWVRVTFEGTEPDGMERFYHQPGGDDLASDHPALPAVARWLAETPGAIETLRIVGMSAVQDRSVPLRHIEKYSALLAALTTEETA